MTIYRLTTSGTAGRKIDEIFFMSEQAANNTRDSKVQQLNDALGSSLHDFEFTVDSIEVIE